ncbi:MAG: hypothetical protein U5K51_01895 [Flavobacteriaceae bacterium]|nr:hypothetical protein [Flavobacteriaceae bacterium]
MASNAEQGDKFIGFGVLLFAFVLLPLFLYHRYHGKDLSQYRFRMDVFKMIRKKRAIKKN